MKVYNIQSDTQLTHDLADFLRNIRSKRAFRADEYVHAKAVLLNEYLRRSSLSSCVVAVSGGLDSAVVLGIVKYAASISNTPIKRTVALLLPVGEQESATNQESATQRGVELCHSLGIEPCVTDLLRPFSELRRCVEEAVGLTSRDWASGQLVAYTRTPAIYFTTSLLAQEGIPGVVCGTTNRDEGAYLGYVGKASDGMVDVQLISDLHKSEVYSVARLLNIPASIINIPPSGDMYDGRIDTEVFGASYDFVELYLNYLCLSDEERKEVEASWDYDSRLQFETLSQNLEKLHSYNAHKYLVGSPAVHLDIYESAVPGGWKKQVVEPAPIDPNKFVGLFDISESWVDSLSIDRDSVAQPLSQLDSPAFFIQELLSGDECDRLVQEIVEEEWTPVGLNGMKGGFDPEHDVIGSWRASCYNPAFAEILWSRLQKHVPVIRVMSDITPTDWDGSRVWRAVGINPLMRFIRYEKDGLLVPHYDGPYVYNHLRRTLVTVVIYFNDCSEETGGATRFLKDPQQHLPIPERELSDWERLPNKDEVDFVIRPSKGSVLVFDHRILHDSEQLKAEGEGKKIILRTDIIFDRCDV